MSRIGGAGITALFLPVSGTSADSVLTAARKITHYGSTATWRSRTGSSGKKGCGRFCVPLFNLILLKDKPSRFFAFRP